MLGVFKPCPKCGADNSQALGSRRIGNRFVGATKYYVKCNDCGHSTRGYFLPTAAALAWNEGEEEEQNADSDK